MYSNKICAPNADGGYTCFTMKSLKKIASKINNNPKYGNKKINIATYDKSKKKKLIDDIQKKLSCNSKLDLCVLKKEDEFYDEIINAFKPPKPTCGISKK
jgi:hypothetical protein